MMIANPVELSPITPSVCFLSLIGLKKAKKLSSLVHSRLLMSIDHAQSLSATSQGFHTGNSPSAEPPCQGLRRGYRTFFNQSQQPPGPLASGPA